MNKLEFEALSPDTYPETAETAYYVLIEDDVRGVVFRRGRKWYLQNCEQKWDFATRKAAGEFCDSLFYKDWMVRQSRDKNDAAIAEPTPDKNDAETFAPVEPTPDKNDAETFAFIQANPIPDLINPPYCDRLLYFHNCIQLSLFDEGDHSNSKPGRPKPPDRLPLWGVSQQALIGAAITRIKKLPDFPEKFSCLLYLQLAYGLAQVQQKTVKSIYWQRANYQARLDVSRKLEQIRGQIRENLEQFGVWWDKFFCRCQQKGVDFESLMDAWTLANEEDWLNQGFRRSAVRQLAESLNQLKQISREMERKLIE